MTKYIYAVADAEDASVEYKIIMAQNLQSAKEKIAKKYFNQWDGMESEDWNDVIQYLWERNIILGEPIDIETL